MAVLHRATISPTKQELVETWLPAQPWAAGLGAPVIVGSYRLDDPDGEVGIECLLLRAGESFVHLPLTYRGAPLEGAEDYLVATMDHSVLGPRWVYDGCADPVAVQELLAVTLTGGEEAAVEIEEDGEIVERRTPTVQVRGSGSVDRGAVPRLDGVSLRSLGATARVSAGEYELAIARLLGAEEIAGDATLFAVWPDGSGTVVGVTRD